MLKFFNWPKELRYTNINKNNHRSSTIFNYFCLGIPVGFVPQIFYIFYSLLLNNIWRIKHNHFSLLIPTLYKKEQN